MSAAVSVGGRAVPVAAAAAQRLPAIDLLRGVAMLLMLLDHVRETFFLHRQVGDPMAVDEVAPTLFVARLLAHLCAPVFVFLTGLSACLYALKQADPRRAASAFLLKRGAFLIALELTAVNFAWTGEFAPSTIYLQVIWAIGIAMVALAALLWLPRPALLTLGVALVAGHHLFDGYSVANSEPGLGRTAWLILHERGWFEIGWFQAGSVRLRTSYPVLPWIGAIALGYVAGAWYAAAAEPARRRGLALAGAALLAGFFAVRLANVYGDAPWRWGVDGAATAMSFFNVTKYPPSLQFLLLTLGVGACLLCLFERPGIARALRPLATFGAAPMFFYLAHLYLLKGLYLLALAFWGANQGAVFGVSGVAALWVIAAAVGLALWYPTQAFARLKARRRDWPWLRYF